MIVAAVVPVKRRTGPKPAGAPDWRPAFLAAYRESGIVSHAAAVAGVDRRTVDRHRKTEPEFATLCLAAEEDATEALEKEARRRALTISDVLLIFLLKARRPAIYRENQRIEVTGADGGPVQTQQLLAGLDDHEKATLRKIIDAALAEAQVTA